MDVGPLVSCEWLQEKINSGNMDKIVVLDVSWSTEEDKYEAYKRRHIAGARYVNVLVGPHTELFPRNIPTPEVFQEHARAAGVNEDSHVIVYSDSDKCGFFVSGRAWWTFLIFGVQKVSILNGGLEKWLSLGYPVTSEIPDVKTGTFKAEFTGQYYRQFDEMTRLAPSEAVLIDSRSLEQFSAGHIPGAKNLPFGELVDNNKLELKPVDDIREVLQKVGVDFQRPFISYCNWGMSSCTLGFAYVLCGGKDFSLYHGGFNQWKSQASDRIEHS